MAAERRLFQGSYLYRRATTSSNSSVSPPALARRKAGQIASLLNEPRTTRSWLTARPTATATATATVALQHSKGTTPADSHGIAPALLPPPQMAALLAIPPGEILKLLDAAGVPHRAADTNADLRTKCAAAHGPQKKSAPSRTSAHWPPAFRTVCSLPSRSPPRGNQRLGTRPSSTCCRRAAMRHGHSIPGPATDSCTTNVPSSFGCWNSSPPPARGGRLPQPSFSLQASKPNSTPP